MGMWFKKLKILPYAFILTIICCISIIGDVWADCSIWNSCGDSSNYYASRCSDGVYTCISGSSASYQITHTCYGESGYRKNNNRCHRCASGEYAVFAYDGGFLNCATCPTDSTWESNHIAGCTNAVDNSGSHNIADYDYLPHYNESVTGFKCVAPYNMFIVDGTTTKWNRYTEAYEIPKQYTCRCENLDGNTENAVYTDSVGNCRNCGDRRGVYFWYNKAYVNNSCENNDIQCTNWGYKAIYNDDYACPSCPSIGNAKNLGLSSSSSSLIAKNLSQDLGNWLSGKRCTIKTADKTEKDENNNIKCKYNEEIAPSANCGNTMYVTDAGIPDVSSLNPYYIESGCDYEVIKRTFTWADAGYGISGGNGTANATCRQCDNRHYSPSGDLDCKELPKNAVGKTPDGGSFVCGAGTYKSDDKCMGCPYYGNGLPQPNSVYGSSLEGAESITDCFMPARNSTTDGSDDTGYFVNVKACPWVSENVTPWIILTWNSSPSDNCRNALSQHCQNYFGSSGNAIGGCVDYIAGNVGGPYVMDTIEWRILLGYIMTNGCASFDVTSYWTN